jgi:hypothetical protein
LSEYDLHELSDKYIKENYTIKLVSRTENEIKFNIEIKPIVVSNKDTKQKLRDKIKNIQNNIGKKSGCIETKYSLGQDKNMKNTVKYGEK